MTFDLRAFLNKIIGFKLVFFLAKRSPKGELAKLRGAASKKSVRIGRETGERSSSGT